MNKSIFTIFLAGILSVTCFAQSTYEQFIARHPQTYPGFITLHQLDNRVYFELPVEMLGREMLVGSTVSATSNNKDVLLGQKPTEPLHVRFEMLGGKINLIRATKDIITDSTRPEMLEAMDKNSAGGIMESFDIYSYRPDSSAILFDMTPFFVSDIKEMRPFDPNSMNTYNGIAHRSVSFQRDKSYLGEVKAFDNNLTVKSYLSYNYSINMGGRNLFENIHYTAQLTRSFLLLEEEPYRPRIVDSRIGIFPLGKYMFSEKEQQMRVVWYGSRWRLEPSDTSAYKRGEQVEPKKPIVFYVDPAFPEDWRPAIFEAVNQWNEPFERIGFKNAIEARDYPQDDADFDPDNMKYSCIRYSPIAIQNAMGPSWVDPRSGEIINASVYVYHNVVKLLNHWRYVQTAQLDESIRGGEMSRECLQDALRYVIGHEVGHCLGLMHNMAGSSTIPVDSLRSVSFTKKYGTTHSIMDYARFNYVAQPEDSGVKLTPPKFGLYDYFAIRYAYTPIFDCSLEEESKILSGWLSKASKNPIYRFGHQQMETLDPRSQIEDLGDDPVKASEYGIRNLKYIIGHFNEWVENDPDYTYRKDIYQEIINQYKLYLEHVYANIGGIYLYDKQEGDGIEDAWNRVPADRQKAAFDFMCAQLDDLDWLDHDGLMKKIQIMSRPSESLEIDIAEAIMAAPFKIASTEHLGADEEIYSVADCMEQIYDLVWTPTVCNEDLTELQMRLQREFVRRFSLGCGLDYKGEGARKNSTASLALETPREDRIPILAYHVPYMMYKIDSQYDSECYGYLSKVRKLIVKRFKSARGKTKDHYGLMIHHLNDAMR